MTPTRDRSGLIRECATVALYATLALIAVAAIVWGVFVGSASPDQIPPPQETGWNHRNFR